jgi:hypothetical protein
MSELSKSNDPRVRRSYAHTMLGRLSRGEINPAVAEDAIRRADKTTKGDDSNFWARLVKARERGAEKRLADAREAHDEATIACEVEIITGISLPDGGFLPIVVGAGSHEDFARASEESERIAEGPGGTQEATTYLLRSMAEAGGLEAELAFYRGAELGRMTERARQAEPSG